MDQPGTRIRCVAARLGQDTRDACQERIRELVAPEARQMLSRSDHPLCCCDVALFGCLPGQVEQQNRLPSPTSLRRYPIVRCPSQGLFEVAHADSFEDRLGDTPAVFHGTVDAYMG